MRKNKPRLVIGLSVSNFMILHVCSYFSVNQYEKREA